MSILDSIHKTEEEAIKRVSDAKAEVREIVHLAENEAKEKGKALITKAQEEAANSYKQQEKITAEKMDEYLKQENEKNKVLAEKARGKMPEVVSFVLERVESL